MTYAVKIYHRQGDGALVVKTGGQILNDSEAQAAHIPNVTGGVTTSAAGTGQSTLNSILVALRGVGILATS